MLERKQAESQAKIRAEMDAIATDLAVAVMDRVRAQLAVEECSPAAEQVTQLMKFLPQPKGRPRKIDRDFEIVQAIWELRNLGYQADRNRETSQRESAISIVRKALDRRGAVISERAIGQIWLRYRRWERQQAANRA